MRVLCVLLVSLCALLLACTHTSAEQTTSVPSKASKQYAAQGKRISSSSTKVYGTDSDFIGAWNELPVDSQAALQRDLEDDRRYVASILRAPIDNGDPGLCTHKDLLKDKQELKRIARRLNDRRVALNQQKKWVRDSWNSVAKIEEEMRQTRQTAKNLAGQIDALNNQKQIIVDHIRKQVLQKELDAAAKHLARLKKPAIEAVVRSELEMEKLAVDNAAANEVLKSVHRKRLTKLLKSQAAAKKAKKPRFQQVDAEAEGEAESETQQEAEAEAETEQEGEAEAEAETEEQQ